MIRADVPNVLSDVEQGFIEVVNEGLKCPKRNIGDVLLKIFAPDGPNWVSKNGRVGHKM